MWCIAMCATGQEFPFRDDLRRQGVTAWFPVTKRKIRVRGRSSRRIVAAWPGYVLIECPLPSIRDSRFRFYLPGGDRIEYLKDEIVATFRLMESLGAYQTHAESERPLGIGESVKVASGLLQGLRGQVKAVCRGRVEIEGGDFPKSVKVPIALISPTNAV